MVVLVVVVVVVVVVVPVVVVVLAAGMAEGGWSIKEVLAVLTFMFCLPVVHVS